MEILIAVGVLFILLGLFVAVQNLFAINETLEKIDHKLHFMNVREK